MKNILVLGFIFLASGIISGAFGAHGLKEYFLGREEEIWKIAVFYQLISALGIVAIVLLEKVNLIESKAALLSALALVLGIIVFSGSLYLLVLLRVKWLGAITPIGGTFLIASWIYLAVSVLKNR